MRRLVAMCGWSVVSAISFAAILCSSSIVFAQTDTTKPIGNYTIKKGNVTVTHPGQPTAVAVKVRDGILFLDVIATASKSRTKALFIDDSILTLGEKSSVKITEHVFDPNTDKRSVIVKLLKGKIRVLVGKAFRGLGSKFEVHTDTAVVAARGTYMVIWTEEGSSEECSTTSQDTTTTSPDTDTVSKCTGLAVLNGVASLSTLEGTIDVSTGNFAVAGAGAPPTMPAPFVNIPSVTAQIAATAVSAEFSPAEISSTDALASQGLSQLQLAETPTGIPGGAAPPGINTNPANIVSGQMDSMMLKEQAAMEGGRDPRGTLNLQLEFGQ